MVAHQHGEDGARGYVPAELPQELDQGGTLNVSALADGRVAIVGPFKPWGGIEGKVVTLAREFLSHGVQVDLVLLRGGRVPYPERLPSQVRIVDLKTRSKPDSVRRLARYLRSARPDALLTVKDQTAKVALLARALARVPAPVFIKATNTLGRTIRRPVQRLMIRLMYPRANGIIANSSGVRDDLVSSFGIPVSRIHVIYNPTVTDDVAERAARDPAHPWLSRDSAIPVIMGAGRLTHQKGFDVLIRAFARLRASRPARLMILGEGPERSSLEALARETGVTADVALPGYVPDPLPYMARAAVFALSSRHEGLPNVLIEAMAAGCKAVVSTDCPSGAAEVLDSGRLGALVPVDDVEALAAAIERALDAPRILEPDALDRFRASRIGAAYLEIMGLLNGKGAHCDSP